MRNRGYKVLNMEVGFVLSGCHCLLIGAVTTALLGYVWKRLRSYCFTRVIFVDIYIKQHPMSKK